MISTTLPKRPLVDGEAERVVGEAPVTARRRVDRRGPMRPDHLAPTRKRLQGWALSRTFRGLDSAILGLVALITCDLTSTGGIWAAPLSSLAPYCGLTLLFVAGLSGAYGLRRRESWARHLGHVAGVMALAALTWLGWLNLVHARPALIQALVLDAGVSVGLMLIAHSLWLGLVRRWRRLGYLTPNVVVVGANDNARLLIERALATGDVAVLGVFDDRRGRAPEAIAGVPVLGDTRALIGHRVMPYVDRVVITVTAAARGRVRGLVERLAVLPNDITLYMDLGLPDSADRALERIADLPLARLSGERGHLRRAVAKRIQDLVIASAMLVLGAPLMLGIALAVKLDCPGPVFFRQRRQGFNNEEIVVWKFRSMRHDQRDPRATRQVRYDDPRITRVGRFIRRTSLDELPQLFNVISGEMSLVGPRPHAPAMKTGEVQSNQIVAHYAHRHRMKPGMTGWAAINGSRGPVDTPERVRRRIELDIAYIERQSFWFDLYIMLMTLPCLLGDGKVAR